LAACGENAPFFDRRLLVGYEGNLKDFSDCSGFAGCRNAIITAVSKAFDCLNGNKKPDKNYL
jgi:hypothetical protein